MRLFRTHAVGLRPAIGRAIAVGVTASVLIGSTPVQAQQDATPAQQWAQLRPQRGAKMKRLGGGRFMTESVRTVAAAGLRELRITGPRNLGGQIIVTAQDVDEARVEVARILKTESMEAAILFANEISIRFEPVGNALEFDIRTLPDAPWEGTDWSARCVVEITIPTDWDLAIDAHHFDYDLQGPFRAVRVDTEYGRIKLRDVTTEVEVRGMYTEVELTNVRGVIDARTTYAGLTVRGAVTAPDMPAQLRNTFGPVTVEELAGAIVIEMSDAPLTLTDAILVGSTSRLLTDNAHIVARIIEFNDAQLEILNGNARVDLTVPRNLSARLNFSVGTGGTIRTRGLEIQTHADLLGRGRLEGVCGTGRGIIDIDVSGAGRITVNGN